jgi:hypothetical protein
VPRLRLGVLVAAVVMSGCALITPRPAPDPAQLRIAELLLIGFNGTQVAGNEEIRRLVCDVKVGGVLLFERFAASGQLQMGEPDPGGRAHAICRLAIRCVGRPLFIADAEGAASRARASYPRLSRRRSWGADDPGLPRRRPGALSARPASTGPAWST